MRTFRIRCVTVALLMIALVGVLSDAPAHASATGAATYVFGQGGSFTSANYGAGAAQLNIPNASAHDDVHHRLFVADSANNRVLIYNLNANNSIPDDTADYVLGQSGFGLSTAALTASGMSFPSGVAYDSVNNRLYVADSNYNRVLVFNVATISNGMSASYVLGQPDFVSQGTATTQTGLTSSNGVAVSANGKYVYVADTNNRRIMVWDSTTLSNGMNAAYVIGQTSFTAGAYAESQSTLLFPTSVAVDQSTNKLYETESNRVGVFDLNSLATGMNATYEIGQTNFTNNSTGVDQVSLNGPTGVAAGGGRVYVVDHGNMRATVYDATNTTNGQPAIAVYGQPDYTSSAANNGGTSASSLAYPHGVSFDPGTYQFFVSDSGNSRVLVFNSQAVTDTASVTIDPSFTFTVGSHTGACNGVTQTGTSSANSVAIGHVAAGASGNAAQDLTVASNAGNGFTVFQSGAALTGASHSYTAVAGTNASPAAFGSGERFGYTTSDTNVAGFTGPNWAALSTTNAPVMINAGAVATVTNCVDYQVSVSAATPAANYTTTVIYTAVPSF